MKKAVKTKKKKSNTLRNAGIIFFFAIVVAVVAILPSIPANKFSYGASTTNGIPFTPAPAKNSLQLETFQLTPTPGANFVPQQATQQAPGQATQPPQAAQPPKTAQPPQNTQPTTKRPASPIVLRFSTPEPLNAPVCVGYEDKDAHPPAKCQCPEMEIYCKGGKTYIPHDGGYVLYAANPCGNPANYSSNGRYCIEKPVIYLYPTTPTSVDVQVVSTGTVTVSDPHYPQDGWKNILANPNGDLLYQGKQYTELFYETSVTTFKKPTSGIVIPTDQLTTRLNDLLDQLGLVGREKQEFIDFWVPQLQALNSPFVYFSLLSPKEKAKMDTVNISPKPDTQIAFIAYFKPVSIPTTDSVLQLPIRPQRKGFVSVEWGGVLDK